MSTYGSGKAAINFDLPPSGGLQVDSCPILILGPRSTLAEVLPDVADMTPNLGYCRLRPLASVCHVNPWIHLFFGAKIKLQPDQIVFQHFDETLSVEPTGVQRFLRLFFGR